MDAGRFTSHTTSFGPAAARLNCGLPMRAAAEIDAAALKILFKCMLRTAPDAHSAETTITRRTFLREEIIAKSNGKMLDVCCEGYTVTEHMMHDASDAAVMHA